MTPGSTLLEVSEFFGIFLCGRYVEWLFVVVLVLFFGHVRRFGATLVDLHPVDFGEPAMLLDVGDTIL